MKNNKTLAVLLVGASIGLSGQAFAAATTAGTVIENKVSLAYKVNTIQQAGLEANSSFTVDHKIDMEIVDNSGTSTIIPGQSISYTYSLANSGNEGQIYQLNLANSADTTTTDATGDSGDITIPAVTYALTGTIPAGTSFTQPGYLTIPSGETAQYTATFTYPQTLVDGTTNIVDGDEIILLATAKAVANDTGGPIAVDTADTDKNDENNIGTKLILFLEDESVMTTTDTDAAGNGTISVVTTTTAVTANFAHDDNGNGDYTDPGESGPGLTFKVIDDPICNTLTLGNAQEAYYATTYSAGVVHTCAASAPTGYTPKAIPGALVEYTITAKNTGSVDATDVTLEQDIANPNAGYTDFLQAGTLGNEATSHGTMAVTADNKLVVTVPTVAVGIEVTITFTALVE